jgi:hypothetical protein
MRLNLSSRLAVIAALAIGALAMPTQVFACDCALIEPREVEAYADVAFIGVVTRVEQALPAPGVMDDPKPVPGMENPDGLPNPSFYGQVVFFRVESVQKGFLDLTHEQSVQTGMDQASCGIDFHSGERWQIYATGSEGYLWTGLCSGNVLLASNAGFPSLPFNLSPLFLVPLVVVVVVVVGGAAFIGYRRGSAEAAGDEANE